MSSRIEQIISDIEEYIEDCKFQPLSTTKIVVNKEEIQELIAELRAKTPEEIKRYQKIISNKEAILADAQLKADQIIAQAQVQTTELVSEHQIMQQAYAQANDIVMLATKQAQDILDNATNEANSIRMSVMAYMDDQLKGLEDILSNSLDTSRARYENLINSLQGYLDVVSSNRAQLFPPETEPLTEEEKQNPDDEDDEDMETIDLSVVDVSANNQM
uniref:ATPase n=1 Tax=Agathobacter sp. TaxID=2021311 RepID=UPI004056AA2F